MDVEKPLENRKLLHQSDFTPGIIHQSAIFQGFIVFRGNVAALPTDGSTEVQFFFAEDESKFYAWNTVNEAWEVVALA